MAQAFLFPRWITCRGQAFFFRGKIKQKSPKIKGKKDRLIGGYSTDKCDSWSNYQLKYLPQRALLAEILTQRLNLTPGRAKNTLINCMWYRSHFRSKAGCVRTFPLFPPRGRVLLGILGGGVQPSSRNLDPISDQKCNFPHPFTDQTSKIHTRFQTWPLGRNYVIIILRLERKQNNYSNPFRIRIFLSLSYSFGIETINTFIHSVAPSKTIPDSRPK